MGRKNTAVVEDASTEILQDEMVDTAHEGGDEVVEVAKTEKPQTKTEKPQIKVEKVTVTASCKTKSPDGDRIVHKYKGEGNSLTEALETLVGSEEDLTDEYEKPFPKNINILVNVSVRKGDYKFDRALAPHVAKDILENKNVALAVKLFGV